MGTILRHCRKMVCVSNGNDVFMYNLTVARVLVNASADFLFPEHRRQQRDCRGCAFGCLVTLLVPLA